MAREDVIEWDSDDSVYNIDMKAANFSLAQVERSAREQGFDDRSDDYGTYFLVLRDIMPRDYADNDAMIELRYDDDEEVMEADFDSVELRTMMEFEMGFSITDGHRDPDRGGAFTLREVLRYTEDPSWSGLDEL